jgi:hypothetical protein
MLQADPILIFKFRSGKYRWKNTYTRTLYLDKSLDSNGHTISGSPTDVWIFQVAGNLDMSATVRITQLEVLKPKISFGKLQLH